MRSLSIAAVLAAATLAPAAQDPRGNAARAVLASMWQELRDGTIDLHGAATSGDRATTRRAELVECFSAIAQSIRGTEAAELLWPAAVLDVDPRADQGMLFVRCQPWFVRREARLAIAAVQPREDLLPWLQARLAKTGKDPETAPRNAAIEILGVLGGPEIKPLLLPLLRERDPAQRIALTRALAGACPGDADVARELVPLVDSNDDNVKITAIQHLGRLAQPFLDETVPPDARPAAPDDLAPLIIEAIGRRLVQDKSWQVRRAATTCLLRARNRLAVPHLIRGLKGEVARAGKERTAELVNSLQQALYQLTGQDIPATAVDQWEKYWASGGERMMIVAGDKKLERKDENKYVRYFSIDIKSERVLFIVDRSGSMLEPARLKGEYANLEAGQPKFDLVRQELEKVVRSLPEDATANVIFFGDDVRCWTLGRDERPRQMPMNDRNKSDLIAFIRLTAPAGSTNLYDALDTALRAAGRGLYDKYYGTDFDTVYLLSDGAPTAGAIVDTELILQRVREANQLRQVAIHTITFGDVNNAVFMGRLASENGGAHVHIE
jgi:hypothetical protein